MDRSLYISYIVLLDKRILAHNRRSLHILLHILNTHHKISLSATPYLSVHGMVMIHTFTFTFQVKTCNFYYGILHVMPCNEMRLNHVPWPESLLTPITPESLPTPITQCQSPCMIKSIIYGLYTSNDHLTKQFHLFSNQKLFGCYTSMIICIQNSCVFLWVANF